MGKMFSKPKMPPIPKAAKYVAPVVMTEVETETEPELTLDEQRTQNVLARQRGRLGTIQTSFRGVLNEMTQPMRKSLLGE